MKIESMPDRVEVAVIGSGPGGAVTACALAEAGRDTLLFEEGPNLPLDSCEPFSRDEMEQKYRNGGITVALGRAKVTYVEGRCAGGGSEINSGLYHRTPPDVLEEWRRDFNVIKLSPDDLAPHQARCEADVSVSLLPEGAPPASLKLHEGASSLGWKSMEVPRWFRYGGSNAGTKQSMTQTYLPRFVAAGGRFLAAARVERFAPASSGWRLSVVASDETGRAVGREISAGALFVAGGAVHGPALLRRSGFSRGVGDTLKLHPTIKVVALFDEEINAPGMGVPVHQVKEFSPRISFGCSISGKPHLALALANHPDRERLLREDWRRMAVYYAMIRGGQGSIRNVPGFRDPLVRYHLTDADLAELLDALGKLCQCLFAAGAVRLFSPLPSAPVLNDEGDIARLGPYRQVADAGLMTIHLFSSCRMSEDPRRGVTDSFGRVHGARDLHIADASLLCGAPGVNPQGTIMAIARRNAMRFIEHLGTKA